MQKRRGTMARQLGTAILAAVALLALSAQASAASAPAVSTGAAKEVTYDTATLTGTINPNGRDTSYYFQYGPTKLYGGQSAIADAGDGTQRVSVSLAVGGLEPLTVYHYRLVAVSPAGPSTGHDAKLLTKKVPLSLAILASPNPLAFGGTATVQGTLSGTGNGDREVALQANPFPYAGFVDVGNPELTLADGGFSFFVPRVTVVTQFRVVTTTNPPVVSPVAVEQVAVTVVSHVRRAHRPHFVRFYGTVTPAADGMQVGVLRIVRGHGFLVGGTILRHHNATSSQFGLAVPLKRGVYRALVRDTSGAQISNYGQPLLIG